MASVLAVRKLKKEYTTLEKDPVPGAVVRPLESNFLHAHFLLHGEVFFDTPFEGGVYHGVLKFPKNYPFAPPSVIMRTSSGRFEQDKPICFSMSDFHPELWSPLWTTRSILTGLVSFMNSDEMTTGGLDAPASQRTDLAKTSLQYCMEQDPLAMQLFSDFLTNMRESRSRLGDSWPPPRPEIPRGSTNQQKDTPVILQPISLPSQQEPLEPGKNAAKNKKKREKEKRKKVARTFIAKVRKNVPPFVSAVVSELSNMGIDVSNLQADHVCWRTETLEEYSELVDAFRSVPDDCTLLVESVVGGRKIATIRLMETIRATPSHTIDVIEIPSPKSGRPHKSGLEHVEFVIGSHRSPINDNVHREVLDEFVQIHPDLDWNLKARDKEINPNVSLQVQLMDIGTFSAKFHLMSLVDVIEAEKQPKYEQSVEIAQQVEK